MSDCKLDECLSIVGERERTARAVPAIFQVLATTNTASEIRMRRMYSLVRVGVVRRV